VQALARSERKNEDSVSDRLHVGNGDDIEQKRALDANEPERSQERMQSFHGIPGDVFQVTQVKFYVVVRRLDVVDFVRIERVQPMLPSAHQNERVRPRLAFAY